jgi:hypothetical protein
MSPVGTRVARVGWLGLGAGFTVLTLVAAGLSLWSWVARRDDHRYEVFRHPISRLDLVVDDGSVTVGAGQPGQVTIAWQLTWSYPRPVVREWWDGDVLRIRMSCGPRWRLPGCAAHADVVVPPDVALTASTSSGDLTVRDLSGDLALTARSGDLIVANTGGRLTADVRAGALTATQLRCDVVQARDDAGPVTLDFSAAPTTVSVDSASGDLGVRVPPRDAYAVSASTSSGRSTVSVREDPTAGRTIILRSQSGDVRVAYSG